MPTKTKSENFWMSNFGQNWIGARNVQKLTNFQNLIFVGISCSFEVKTWFYHYSDFTVDDIHEGDMHEKQHICERKSKKI